MADRRVNAFARERGHERRASFALVFVVLLCCAGMLCFATGCRNSDALKEIIYEQDSEIIDYENEEKYLISNPDADQESDEVSSDEASAVDKETERTQNLVVYSSTPNTDDFYAAKAIWDPDPDFFGIEASEAVWLVEDEDDEVEDQEETISDDESTDEDIEETAEGRTESAGAEEGEAASDSGLNGEEGSGGSGEGDEEGELNETGEEEKNEEGDVEGVGGDEAVINDLTGDFAEPPEVDHIAAYGDLAVIVQMIGGENALTAADETLLSSSGFQKVFADEGAADIAVGWSGSGSGYSIDVDAIIESGAECILITDSDYADDLKKSQIKKLNEAGITFELVSPLTNTTFIKKAVTTVGKMLKSAEDIGEAGNTVQNAKDYKNFFNDLLDDCIEANDGAIASYNGSLILEQRNTGSYTHDTSAAWTLLIDAWDDSVTWTATDDLEVDGAAFSITSYETRATSFYLQCGGVINNAAVKIRSTSGYFLVWQYYGATFTLYKDNFSYKAGGIMDQSFTPQSTRPNWAGNGWGMTLLSQPEATSGSSISGSVAGVSAPGLGSDEFPTAIAATQEIKEEIIESSKGTITAYKPYEYFSQSSISGQYAPNADLWDEWACIGSPGDTSGNVFASNDYVITDDTILVSPHGLFSSWTEGTSAESVLITAWVIDEVNDTADTVGWKSYVEEFYETFYRYELTSSDLKTIEEGLEE